MQAQVDSGRRATPGNYVPLIDHSFVDHHTAVGFELLVCARMCRRAAAPKKTCGSQKESASAHRYLQWHGPSSFQPINKTAVMLEIPGAEPTGHKKHVIGIEGLIHC